jgi:Domain of unknown function (DUF929)
VGRKTNKQQRVQSATTAREKAAAARETQRRLDQRRRARTVLSSVLVVAIVIAGIAAYVIFKPAKKTPGSDGVPASAIVAQQVTNVSDATLTTVGKGNVATTPSPVTGESPLISNGKPEVLYIGAEFCPFCAIERWSLAIALSKFGTLTKLSQVHSAPDDGNYASLDFLNPKYKSSFVSKYITFTSLENENRSHATLETPNSAQNALWYKLTNNSPGFPFIDFGNKFGITVHPPLDPSVLGKLTQKQVAAQLNNPTSKVAQVIDGGANDDIAAMCSMTGNKPASVCSTPLITSLQSTFSG